MSQQVAVTVHSVHTTEDPDVLIAQIELPDSDGPELFVSRKTDIYGIGPGLRAVLEEWVAAGQPVTPWVEPTAN